MFLVVITDFHIGSKSEGPCVCRKYLVEDFKEGGLSRPVIPDDGNMFSTLDFKTHISKQHLIGEGFAKGFHSKHVVAAYA